MASTTITIDNSRILSEMLISRDNFDKILSDLIQEHHQNTQVISLKNIKRSDRHTLHTYTRNTIKFVSIGKEVNGCRDMDIHFTPDYISEVSKLNTNNNNNSKKRKCNIDYQLDDLKDDIFNYINMRKKDIKNYIEDRINEFKKTFSEK